MENYRVINGHKVELNNEQVEKLRRILNTKVCVSEVVPGEPFEYCGVEFVVLEHTEAGAFIITKDCISDDEEFGSNNNFADENCNVRKVIEKFFSEFNRNDFVEFDVDLTSDDGLKDYGTFKTMSALLTAEQYRKYVDILDKHKLNKWWWLATPFSTPTHESAELVKCVSPRGVIGLSCSNDYDIGVRPVYILKSNIFVSK